MSSTEKITKETLWIKRFQKDREASLRIFCFHYAGGGTSAFHSWSENLTSNVEVCAVQLPGRENRFHETPFTDIEKLIAAVAGEIESYLTMPFVFFGHSMGSLVSYELFRYLEKHKANLPEHLFVSGRPAPHLPRKTDPIHNLPEDLFIREIEKFEGISAEILHDAEMREFFFPTLRADLELCEKYQYTEQNLIDIPITVYGGKTDAGVSLNDLEAWGKLTKAACRVTLFDGGHFYFNKSRNEFFAQLNSDLEKVIKNVHLKRSAVIFSNKPTTIA